MASLKVEVPLARQPMPRETKNRRPSPPPRRPKMVTGAEPAAGGGVLKCACFHLPSRSKKKPAPALGPPVTAKPRSASRRSAVAPDAPAVLTHSQQSVTFLASASLSTWWPSSPSAAPAPGGGSVAPTMRASTSSSAPAPARNAGAPRVSSSSFSHWRRSLSSRVMPHGGAASGRASFSFPTSPASASSSCMSTPKIPHGSQQHSSRRSTGGA